MSKTEIENIAAEDLIAEEHAAESTDGSFAEGEQEASHLHALERNVAGLNHRVLELEGMPDDPVAVAALPAAKEAVKDGEALFSAAKRKAKAKAKKEASVETTVEKDDAEKDDEIAETKVAAEDRPMRKSSAKARLGGAEKDSR